MAPFWDPWLRPYGTVRWRAWKWRCAHALSTMDFGLGPQNAVPGHAPGSGPTVSTEVWRVAFGRPLPGPPQSTLESGVRAIFFHFLSSAHRAPNETRQTPVEAVIRDPTRTSGHHFPGSHSKIHVGKEMWYAIAPLRAHARVAVGGNGSHGMDNTHARHSSQILAQSSIDTALN